MLLFLRVKKEVDDVIGMKQEISYEDLGKLVYLSQVHIVELGKMNRLTKMSTSHCNLPPGAERNSEALPDSSGHIS